MKLMDYQCKVYETENFLNEAIKIHGLTLPQAHFDKESVIKITKEISNLKKDKICVLPFCHTIEAENLGGIINYGNEEFGPRVASYRFSSLGDLLNELDNSFTLDFSTKRLGIMMEAIGDLKKENIKVMYEVTGPITLLSSLIDLTSVFKSYRKDKDSFIKVLELIRYETLKMMKELTNLGVDIISYADSVASYNILGPALTKFISENFTMPLIKEVKEINKKNVENGLKQITLHICPKTTYPLVNYEYIDLVEIKLNEKNEIKTYIDVILQNENEGHIFGDRCINFMNSNMNRAVMKEIKLR